MPRSMADHRLDRTGSVGKGSVGRYSIGTDVSIGSNATRNLIEQRHWVNSVSDIYGPDEIEELLEDLQRLEQAAFETEDIQDFDIDGSQVGQQQQQQQQQQQPAQQHHRRGRHHSQPHHHQHHQPHPGHRHRGRDGRGRHPGYYAPYPPPPQQQLHPAHHPSSAPHESAANADPDAIGVYDEDCVLGRAAAGPASPTFSVCSWDSHANYQYSRDGDDDDGEGGGGGGGAVDAGDGGGGLRGRGRGRGIRGLFSSSSSSPRTLMLCYCDMSTFASPKTLIRVLLLLTSIACLCTALTSVAGTAKTGLLYAFLPHHLQSKLRLMVFVCLFTILLTLFVLLLDISHLSALLPLRVGKLQTFLYFVLAILFTVASSLLVKVHSAVGGENMAHVLGQIQTMLLASPSEADDKIVEEYLYEYEYSGGGPEEDMAVEESESDASNGGFGDGSDQFDELSFWTKNHFLIVALLGFLCSLESFLCLFNLDRWKQQKQQQPNQQQQRRPRSRHGGDAVDDRLVLQDSSTHFNLQESGASSRQHNKQYLENENYRQQQQQLHHSDRERERSYAKMNHVPSSSTRPASKSSAGPPIAAPIPPPPQSTKPSHHGSKPSSQQQQQQQHNRHKSKEAKTPTSPTAESSFTEMEAAAVVEAEPDGGGGRNTGAIPKKQNKTGTGERKRTKPTSSASSTAPAQQQKSDASKSKQAANHLDEIIALPLDDNGNQELADITNGGSGPDERL